MQGKEIYTEILERFKQRYSDIHRFNLNFKSVLHSKMKNWLDVRRKKLREESGWTEGAIKPYKVGEWKNGRANLPTCLPCHSSSCK